MKPAATRKAKKVPMPKTFCAEPVIVDLSDLAEFKAKFGLRTVASEWQPGTVRPVLYVEPIQPVKE